MVTKIGNDESITFAVDDVEPAARPRREKRMFEVVKATLGTEIESCSDYHQSAVAGTRYHPLLAAVYTAHSQHYPLTLTPEAVWITCAQGVAHHMLVHGERLRDRFVSHEGQLQLSFVVDDWVEKSPENPWCDAFEDWAGQIREHVGDDIYHTLQCDFSASGPVERAVGNIVMMDVFQRYFRYDLAAICGIPSVTLQGPLEDWQRLSDKVDGLAKFDLDWWLPDLKAICAQFVRARRGDIDLAHWQDICKLTSAYGGDIINGWIAKLFPYVRAFAGGPCTRRNQVFTTGEGITTRVAPSGLSRVPFDWINIRSNQKRRMEAIGGLTVMVQESGNSLKPILGWVIREVNELESLIHRLRNEHNVQWHGPDSQSAYDEIDGLPSSSCLPADLERLYFEYESVEIESHEQTIRILPESDIRSVDWGEKPDKFGGSRGPDGKTWHKFAQLSDGRFCLINLDLNRRDSRPHSVYDRCFAPICISQDGTVGGPNGNPVIAYTFAEWLAKTMDWVGDDARDSAFYWDDAEFKSVREAETYVRDER